MEGGDKEIGKVGTKVRKWFFRCIRIIKDVF